jgi:hypothetical protein
VKNNHNYPALTASQRAYIASVITRRREIEAEIKKLRAEFAALPTNDQLEDRFGVTTSTLHNTVRHAYLRAHPLDARAAQPFQGVTP